MYRKYYRTASKSVPAATIDTPEPIRFYFVKPSADTLKTVYRLYQNWRGVWHIDYCGFSGGMWRSELAHGEYADFDQALDAMQAVAPLSAWIIE